MTERPSLRERRRQETRTAISWAAIRLAVERGLDNVTIEDIANEAGVSPRTVNNYFSSKAEAIAARHHDRAIGIAERVRARPADEPIWEAITQAALARFEADHTEQTDQTGPVSTPDPEWTQGVQLMMAEPALQGEFQKANVAAEIALSQAVADRTGTDADHDLYPLLVATAAGAAIRAAMAHWARADPPVSFREVLREVFSAVTVEL
ncbi:TetR family transcriptional regulator [Amycolatopsis sp. FDAARGOS 1241]|uniref:acyl-CoA-like ligand-binding transcription factor n=1 Tax=Amycolatopsis sp. FDAARGOS 1241 TaxID=2778070 RepID=UPI00195178AC|nr:TetR family transcriptional regulator [Amycolatopsis sp. FDAARGOS 1241]QRP47666.1 TetR family transcriptional regulator [Amycolatopsis sp. FDAARGOS 1241]